MIVAIVALYGGGTTTNTGHVRVFLYNGSQWNQMGSEINGNSTGDISGNLLSMSSDGMIVSIGGKKIKNGSYTGHVRLYSYDGIQ